MATSKFDVEYKLNTVQGRLNYARVARRIPRSAAGKAYGARPDTIKNWERGENGTASVPYDFIVFAAIAYAVPEAWLLGETNDVDLPKPCRQTGVERLMFGLSPSPETLMRRRLTAANWERAPRTRPDRAEQYIR